MVEIDAASNNGVDEIRSLIERVSLTPIARRRVVILDEAHCMTSNAANALLKTLEEPPGHTLFILCTTEAHKLLPTIISRCQTFEFHALAPTTIAEQLSAIAEQEGINITDDALLTLARHAQGGMRDALQLLGQASLSSDGAISVETVMALIGGIPPEDLLSLMKAILKPDVLRVLTQARRWLESGRTPPNIIATLLPTYRDLLLIKGAGQSVKALITSGLTYKNLSKLAHALTIEQLNQSLALLKDAERRLGSHRPEVWLEVCLLNLIPGYATQPTVAILPVKDSIPSTPVSLNGKPSQPLDDHWRTIIEAAPEKAQPWLSRLQLVNCQNGIYELTGDKTTLNKLSRASRKVAQLIQKTTGDDQLIVITFKPPEEVMAS